MAYRYMVGCGGDPGRLLFVSFGLLLLLVALLLYRATDSPREHNMICDMFYKLLGGFFFGLIEYSWNIFDQLQDKGHGA